MSITKCPGHMRSLKLNFSATVLTLGLKVKIFKNLRLCQAKFWGELRTRATFDRCVPPFSSPEPTILLACGWDRELWFGPTPEVRITDFPSNPANLIG